MKLSERQFRRLRAHRGLEELKRAVQGSKYRNTATVVDGLRFDSKLEARRYAELKDLQAAGMVAWFIRQPSFDLAGGVKYRADFLVVWEVRFDGERVSVEDCKGFETPAFKLKRRLFAIAYPKVQLRMLTSKDVRR